LEFFEQQFFISILVCFDLFGLKIGQNLAFRAGILSGILFLKKKLKNMGQRLSLDPQILDHEDFDELLTYKIVLPVLVNLLEHSFFNLKILISYLSFFTVLVVVGGNVVC